MPRKARLEGAVAEPIVGYPASDDLANIVAAFKAAHPVEWEALRLCPLQHGLDDMIAKLKG